MEFTGFPKIPRLARDMTISEKIDGTNASVCIRTEVWDDPFDDSTILACREWPQMLIEEGPLAGQSDVNKRFDVMRAGSRKRWLARDQTDNFGFAAWVRDNADELWKFGPGHHFGEWWGRGIQRGYGLNERRFSMFNPKWLLEGPDCVSVVPHLWTGPFDTLLVKNCLQSLRENGSFASPGFMPPEGIVIFHHAANLSFKMTIENDDTPKSKSCQTAPPDKAAGKNDHESS